MKKIVILDSADFIEPPKSNQHVFCSTLKHGDMAQIERDSDVIIYNGNVIANRYGNAGEPIDLNALITRNATAPKGAFLTHTKPPYRRYSLDR